MAENHEIFMKRALELAQFGLGDVSPNPLVGCVVVHQNNIIGEGYHQKYGQSHAEVNAIHSVENKNLLSNSEVYVTLEPCNHYGKTPPCTELLIKSGVRKVIVCNLDPNPLVAGKGVERLKSVGIEVELGVLAQEGNFVNRRFFTFHQKHRPFIILKWAQTNDSFIAKPNYNSKWISNEYARKLVHKWRSEEDAVLVGFQTAFYDNPQLNTRDWKGKNPIRIYVDRDGNLPQTHFLKDASIKTIEIKNLDELATFSKKYPDIHSIIIEGGTKTLQYFINNNMWDEARIFTSKTSFEKGIKAPILNRNVDFKMDVLGDELQILYNL
jgi:diaminohydroxyphosphoribosylaminopyrimidine deaminase/5-amino-6-(5-phosphoribosylamino)uracil reductase